MLTSYIHEAFLQQKRKSCTIYRMHTFEIYSYIIYFRLVEIADVAVTESLTNIVTENNTNHSATSGRRPRTVKEFMGKCFYFPLLRTFLYICNCCCNLLTVVSAPHKENGC